MNICGFTGRLVREVEPRQTTNGTNVGSFTLAVQRNRTKDVDFIDCIAWGASSNYLVQYATKGSIIEVSGELHTRTYETNDGRTRKVVEVNCSSVKILSSSKNGAKEEKLTNEVELGDTEILPF